MLRLLRLAVVAAGVSAAVRSSMMHPWPLLHRRLQESSGVIGNVCRDTTDCPAGSVCIAGSATTSIQSCVQTPGCGGNVAGNCPGLLSTGQLVCAWSPVNASRCSDNQNSCAAFNGQAGIYMCMTLDRCDAINGNKGVCSSGCKSSNGLICNGRGGCRTTNGASYTCECNDGWDGPACEKVVNSSCQAGVGSCGQFGQCVDGTCSCVKGYSGQQCELSPNATTTSPSATTAVVTLPTPTSDSASSSSKATAGGSSNTTTSWWWILLVVVVALAFVLIVAFFVRKKMQQREADRARAEVGELMEGDIDDGVQTPKGMIQTL